MESTRERFRDDVASPREVAEALGVSEEALKQLRYRRRGPRYVKVGSRIFYRWSDVERYFDTNTVDPSQAS
jgi:hypothetical protein